MSIAVEILEKPLDTVPSRELGQRDGFTRGALDGPTGGCEDGDFRTVSTVSTG
jgi:hypothetical protein